MIQLEVGGQVHPVPPGEVVVGADAASGIRLSGQGVLPRHAVLLALPDGSVAVRPAAADAELYLNDVRLTAEPSPILHGDKIRIGLHELLVTESKRTGSTQYVDSSAIANLIGARAGPSGAAKPIGTTGGRLVCLTDGREYTVVSPALVFGREAGSDVVVSNKDVSRRHAEIMPTSNGYLLVDHSTNGTFVNGERIQGQRLLARADMIRIGDHEFRFYADSAPPPPPATAPPPATGGGLGKAPEATPAAPPPGAAERLNDTFHGTAMPIAQPTPAAVAGPMASLLVRSGGQKGQRLSIRVPVINIGRGDYNDVVLTEESVSTAHAKLQRREGVWILTDVGSTNGTFVDGERVETELPVSPGATIRFGDVSVLFEPTDDAYGTARSSGTKMVEAVRPAPAPPPAAARAPARPAQAAPVAQPPRPPSHRPVATGRRRSGLPHWLVPALIVAVLAAAAAFFLFK